MWQTWTKLLIKVMSYHPSIPRLRPTTIFVVAGDHFGWFHSIFSSWGTLYRWLWIVDHSGLVVAGCALSWILVGCLGHSSLKSVPILPTNEK